MHLKVTPFDGVVVTLPLRLSRYVSTDSFVRENSDWVLQKLRESGRHRYVPRKMQTGSIVPFRGLRYRLVVMRLSVSSPHVVHNRTSRTITLYLPRRGSADTGTVLRDWMKQEADRVIREVARTEARSMSLRYGNVSVRGQKTKWGSCNSDGDLTFNWRLILFPPNVLRYIVIHELCHIRQFDHSLSFWKLVARAMPDYKEAADWLKIEGMDARNLLVDI